MSHRLLYLIGEPGAGKSTLMAELVAGLDSMQCDGEGLMPRVVYFRPGVTVAAQLGRVRETFSGTDALGMAIQPKAIEWLRAMARTVLHEQLTLLGEGDRLGNSSFLDSVVELGYEVELAYLDILPHVSAARRSARGSTQSEAWVRGRVTKVRNVARDWTAAGRKLIRLDAHRSPPEVLGELVAQSRIAADVRAAAEGRR